ncbi:alpha-ketoglutarate-dependent dioxygenase AlkB family protein [Halioxenophilus sp. WMMB6]|uniref:alpha-ketoglutarate-dependent dioxygenase AlkB family protein n=1 Tax=Halioxenophilus sp. WMMB6 TaxID=3073815 RepID=UPI00295E92E7|nr:alpha-ketoglutarate-dependent dioxygenase AlkB [Halioxenophilus sp. WMMB6]
MQSSLFSGWNQIEAPDADIHYWPGWLTYPEQAEYYRKLQQLQWQQSSLRIAGRQIPIPRLNAWYGDEGCKYGYSGVKLPLLPWTEELAELRGRVVKECNHRFNSVLVNFYRTGEDSVDWHADDEPELGRKPVIACVSLGAIRRFHLKPRRVGVAATLSLDLEPGSLLLMAGETQSHWLHRVAKTKKQVEGRISLTFRQVYTDDQKLFR